MCGLGLLAMKSSGGQSMKALPPTPETAKQPDAQKQDQVSYDRKKMISKMGLDSTKVTGSTGIEDAPVVGGKKLLGGV